MVRTGKTQTHKHIPHPIKIKKRQSRRHLALQKKVPIRRTVGSPGKSVPTYTSNRIRRRKPYPVSRKTTPLKVKTNRKSNVHSIALKKANQATINQARLDNVGSHGPSQWHIDHGYVVDTTTGQPAYNQMSQMAPPLQAQKRLIESKGQVAVWNPMLNRWVPL